jgi:flavin reductase (DIM6/NTAB) family NADH-FMN oxidoreductase RutF
MPFDAEADDRELRRVLGHFATGVVVLTAHHAGERAGVTVNSFSSLSLRPPLVLFSVMQNLRSLPVFIKTERIGISILSADQQEVSHRFASAGADKWAGTPVSAGPSGAILIDNALAHLECDRHAVVDGGDHLIFVCRVLASRSHPGEPLMYFRGGYLRGPRGIENSHSGVMPSANTVTRV